MEPAAAHAVTLEELARELQSLRERVGVLEHRLEGHATPEPLPAGPEPVIAPELASVSAGEWVPVIGKALLGIAGAYLLRAMTELGTISHATGVAAGFLYAAFWLYQAVRTPIERRFAALTAAFTSVLILGPLLFEASQRFHAISDWTSAVVLVSFAGLAVALCWNKPGSYVPVIVTGGTALFGLVFLVALRDLLPFTFALLAIAAAVEFAACFDRETSSRPWLAAAADTGMLIAAYIGGRLPESWVRAPSSLLVAAQIALLVIYVASTAARTIVQRRQFTAFETVQTVVAFVIGLGGAFHIAQTSGTGTWAIGAFALVGGAACYLFVARQQQRGRNFHTYAAFALLSTLTGSFLLLDANLRIAAWGVYAVACGWLGRRTGRYVLALHGAAALCLGALTSAALAHPYSQLFEMGPAPVPVWAVSVLTVAALLSYVPAMRKAESGMAWDERLAAVIAAALLVWLSCGTLSHGLTLLSPELSAMWGMVVVAVLAAILAALSAEWRRGELRGLVWALMAVAALKLLRTDLRQQHTLGLVVSLLAFGGMLVLVPRILRRPRDEPAAE